MFTRAFNTHSILQTQKFVLPKLLSFQNFQFHSTFPKISKNFLFYNFPKAFMRSMKSKRKARLPDPKYKMKTKNSLRKRVVIVNISF